MPYTAFASIQTFSVWMRWCLSNDVNLFGVVGMPPTVYSNSVRSSSPNGRVGRQHSHIGLSHRDGRRHASKHHHDAGHVDDGRHGLRDYDHTLAVAKAASASNDQSATVQLRTAQADPAGAADSVASLTFDAIAAVNESATASSSVVSYIGVVNLASESLNAVAVQDATSVGLCTVTETASAAVVVDSLRYVSGDVTEASAAVEPAASGCGPRHK